MIDDLWDGEGAMELQAMRSEDWPAVRVIYEAGIATGDATFETTAPDWPVWDAAHLADHRLVARLDGWVVGWAALAPVSDRCAYAGVAENSIYVAPEAQGRGVGRALLTAVVASAEQAGIWTVQTGIFPENHASVRLHEACGFRVVGVRERLGQLHGRWRDVLLLERRSPVIA
jgi:L-amino acid N-acyltransferase YncA